MFHLKIHLNNRKLITKLIKIFAGHILILVSTNILIAQDRFIEDIQKYGDGKVYLQPDQVATFPGEREGLQYYFEMRFDPYVETDMLESAKNGTVEAKFIVETNGKIKYVEIIKHYTENYDQEMISTILSMPKWQPAIVGGQKVRSFQTYSWTLKFYMR